MTMRVAHVVRQYHPSVGGMEDVVRSICGQQRDCGHQSPRIVTLDRLFRNGEGRLPATERIDDVPVRRLPWAGSSRYPLCPAVLRAIGDADVVHVHGVDFFYDFLAATRLIHRKPLVLSTHGGFFHTDFASPLKNVWFRTITRWSALAYENIVATSENDGRRFSEISGPGRLKVIENGVNTSKYAGCGSPKLNRTLIYFGRWSSNKGLIEALDLMSLLTAMNPDWRLIIAGREYDYSAHDLQARIDQHHLTDVVTLHPNPSDEAMRQLIFEASFFLCLSRHEGFGLAAIEAMSAGLTPVLSDIPPFRRLVNESGLGVRAAAKDGPALAEPLTALFNLGDGAHHQRRQAAMAFADRYSWNHVASHYIELYDQIGRRV